MSITKPDFDLTACPEWWALAMYADQDQLDLIPHLYEFATEQLP